MTLPSSGVITIGDINVELGLTRTAQLDLNASNARTLAGIASGQIKMSDFYGKSNITPGSQTFGPGSYSFTTPRYLTMVVQLYAGGGGGHGAHTNDGYMHGYDGSPDGGGGPSSYNIAASYGGGADGSTGYGAGGTVVAGGGGGGGGGSPPGGPGGYVSTTYSYGSGSAPGWGSVLTLDVGGGGGGGAGANDVGAHGAPGAPGGNGTAIISWS
jgi:hypothetical protein